MYRSHMPVMPHNTVLTPYQSMMTIAIVVSWETSQLGKHFQFSFCLSRSVRISSTGTIALVEVECMYYNRTNTMIARLQQTKTAVDSLKFTAPTFRVRAIHIPT